MRPRPWRDERGSGLIGLGGAVLVFLTLLFTAVQISFHLHARSALTDVTSLAARDVAGYRPGQARTERAFAADTRLRAALDAMGARDVSVDWGDLGDPDVVRLHVVASPRGVLPEPARAALGLGRFDRTITIRVERPR